MHSTHFIEITILNMNINSKEEKQQARIQEFPCLLVIQIGETLHSKPGYPSSYLIYIFLADK